MPTLWFRGFKHGTDFLCWFPSSQRVTDRWTDRQMDNLIPASPLSTLLSGGIINKDGHSSGKALAWCQHIYSYGTDWCQHIYSHHTGWCQHIYSHGTGWCQHIYSHHTGLCQHIYSHGAGWCQHIYSHGASCTVMAQAGTSTSTAIAQAGQCISGVSKCNTVFAKLYTITLANIGILAGVQYIFTQVILPRHLPLSKSWCADVVLTRAVRDCLIRPFASISECLVSWLCLG